MNLADYQQKLVDQIYTQLVEDESSKGITLFGDTGCGKTTIALAIADQLVEGWAVFYVRGIGQDLSPYLTWHIGTKLFSKTKLNLTANVSFGVDFQPHLVSMGLGASLKNINYVLTPSEEALISNIKKQAAGNSNILFIADDYDLWDIPSKQLLQKISIAELGLLSGYHVAMILVSREMASLNTSDSWRFINAADVSDDGILFVLRQNGFAGQVKVDDIRACAGNDLSLALMAARYYDEFDSSDIDFHSIMDKRYQDLSTEEQDACKVLEPLSILDTCFTADETAYFIDSSYQHDYETEYQAGEYLLLAEKQSFITGKESYHFANEKIKDYFRSQLARREKLYHRKFADYLQRKHPEDYYCRGKHTMQSLSPDAVSSIIDSWQLFLLAYIRRSMEIGNTDDVYKILETIKSLIDRLPPDLASKQHNVLEKFLCGYHEFAKYEYKKALSHLQAISPSQLSSACRMECQRLILLCHIQLAESQSFIMGSAEELREVIEADGLCEDEQYCHAALVLLDVYLDRSSNQQSVADIKNKMIRIIQNHRGSPIFEEFDARMSRKAALFYAATVAFQQTEQSIKLYRSRYSRNGLYMALCNHSGNAIVSGQYSVASDMLRECHDMLADSSGWYYPSQYKIANNQILLDYLIGEANAADTPEEIIAVAQSAANRFSEIADFQKDEVSYVILFNRLGLSILSNSQHWRTELELVNKQYTELDEYYQYFLHDLNFAAHVLSGNAAGARCELETLEQLDVPLLSHYGPIFRRRKGAQRDILGNMSEIGGNALEYHRRIKEACLHTQDAASHFFGRGFLLSDLQFLSF